VGRCCRETDFIKSSAAGEQQIEGISQCVPQHEMYSLDA